jgi:hypothetical protein
MALFVPLGCPSTGVSAIDLRFLASSRRDALREGLGVFVGLGREPEGMVADRRYEYGDPRSPSRFWPAWSFVGSIVSRATGKALTLVIGLAPKLNRENVNISTLSPIAAAGDPW